MIMINLVVVCLMTYVHVKLTLFIIYLDYIKIMLKRVRDKAKVIFRRQKKIKIKYINVLKIE